MTGGAPGDSSGQSESGTRPQQKAIAFGVLAHELRSPVAALRAMAEFLLTDNARQLGEWEFFHRSLHDQTVLLSDLLDNLLEAARMASGKAKWNWEEFRLDVACSEALDSVRPLIDRARIALDFAARPPDAAMQGDRDAVHR